MKASPIEAVRALHRALEAGVHGPALASFFTADATTVEHPNLVTPRGRTSDLAAILRASSAGARLLAHQSYEVRSAIEVGSLAIVRLAWRATVAEAIGPFAAGQALRAEIAQFAETREGKIASLETYDCYEPFGRD